MILRFLVSAMVLAGLSGCGPAAPPASNVAPPAATLDQGVIIAERTVGASASGAAISGITGSATEQTPGDTPIHEYVVRKSNGDLVSVTQQDRTPLVIGEKVLVVTGTRARVVAADTAPPPAKVDTTPRT